MINFVSKMFGMLNDLSVRARIFIFIVLAFLGFFIGYKVWWSPLWQQRASVTQQIKTTEKELAQLKNKLLALKTSAASAVKPLVACNINMPPEKMIEVIGNILEEQHDLTLIEIKNLTEEPKKEVASTAAESTGTASTTAADHLSLYKHKIYIKFSGEYFAVLTYLQSLERLKWCLTWDELNYKVLAYPIAEVTLVVHTMSDKAGFLYV